MIRPLKSVAVLTVALLASAAFLGACSSSSSDKSSDSSSASSASSDSGAICTDLSALKKSLQSLTNLDVTAGGTNAVNQALTEIKNSFNDLKASASSTVKGDIDQVQKDIDAVGTALKNLNKGGTGAGAADLSTALSNLGKDVGTLITKISTGCPDLSSTDTTSSGS